MTSPTGGWSNTAQGRFTDALGRLRTEPEKGIELLIREPFITQAFTLDGFKGSGRMILSGHAVSSLENQKKPKLDSCQGRLILRKVLTT